MSAALLAVPLAHTGHWLEGVLVAMPLLLLVVGLLAFAILECRRRAVEPDRS